MVRWLLDLMFLQLQIVAIPLVGLWFGIVVGIFVGVFVVGAKELALV
jgi:hypothetical protein